MHRTYKLISGVILLAGAIAGTDYFFQELVRPYIRFQAFKIIASNFGRIPALEGRLEALIKPRSSQDYGRYIDFLNKFAEMHRNDKEAYQSALDAMAKIALTELQSKIERGELSNLVDIPNFDMG